MGQSQYVPGGYYLIARKLFDSPIWSDNPHILKLFIYLIGQARHEKKPKRYPGFLVKRGELVTSLNQIADENKYEENGTTKRWSKSKVHRMLKYLEKNGYIELIPDTYGTHVKVLNYIEYQDPKIYRPNAGETQVKRRWNAGETQVELNKNGNNDKNDKKEKRIKNTAFSKEPKKTEPSEPFYLTKKKKKLKGWKLETFELFWKTFNWKKDKANASDAWLQIPCLTQELAIKQIIPAAEYENNNRQSLLQKGRTPKWAQGWLSGRRWEDEKFNEEFDEWAAFRKRREAELKK